MDPRRKRRLPRPRRRVAELREALAITDDRLIARGYTDLPSA